MSARQKKLWELQQQLRDSRKDNAKAVVAERKRQVPAQHAWIMSPACRLVALSDVLAHAHLSRRLHGQDCCSD